MKTLIDRWVCTFLQNWNETLHLVHTTVCFACLASDPVRAERNFGPREGVFAFGRHEKWDENKKGRRRGWGRRKRNACPQTPLNSEKRPPTDWGVYRQAFPSFPSPPPPTTFFCSRPIFLVSWIRKLLLHRQLSVFSYETPARSHCNDRKRLSLSEWRMNCCLRECTVILFWWSRVRKMFQINC